MVADGRFLTRFHAVHVCWTLVFVYIQKRKGGVSSNE